jgi:hypothetical protein
MSTPEIAFIVSVSLCTSMACSIRHLHICNNKNRRTTAITTMNCQKTPNVHTVSGSLSTLVFVCILAQTLFDFHVDSVVVGPPKLRHGRERFRRRSRIAAGGGERELAATVSNTWQLSCCDSNVNDVNTVGVFASTTLSESKQLRLGGSCRELLGTDFWFENRGRN